MKLNFLARRFSGILIAEQLAGVSRLSLVGSVTLIAVLVLLATATTLNTRQITTLVAEERDTLQFNAALLQMRNNEKDFFERKTTAELDRHASSAKDTLDLLVGLDGYDHSGAQREMLKTLRKDLTDYLANFKIAADGLVAIGLTENDGLQDTMRKAARELEADVVKAGLSELTVSVLQLRRNEKDFILREREQYIKQHADELQAFKNLTNNAKIDPTQRTELARLVAIYAATFQQLVASTQQVNKELAAARAAARDAEKPIPQIVADLDERIASTLQRGAIVGISLDVLGAMTLIGVTLLTRRSLRRVSASIGGSVASLQNTVERVRAGEKLAVSDGVKTQDEIGAVWNTVFGLLTDREAAQKKAEDENERLNNSVISILQSVNQLSQRDLTARAPVTQDIIGTVSDSINALTDETAKVLNGVSRIAGQVATASGKVQTQGALVSKTAEDDRVNVGQMIESLTSATQTMNQVAALTEQTNASASQATQATDSALETVNGTVKGMESIRETIAETEKRIKRLGERSQEISGIVNLINTISERTHVLALNASMQAAVAGEAGRGFAVVAEEVQRLAESSRNATQQIGTLVNNIQLETNETISTVNRTIGQVVQGSEQAQKAGDQMRRTQQITAQLVAQVQRIALASDEQKKTSAQLLASVQQISASSERTAEQITTQNVETASLLDFSRKLVESVNVFKLPLAAA